MSNSERMNSLALAPLPFSIVAVPTGLAQSLITEAINRTVVFLYGADPKVNRTSTERLRQAFL